MSKPIGIPIEPTLEGMEKEQLEIKLAAAYAANSPMNLEMVEEFEQVDHEDSIA